MTLSNRFEPCQTGLRKPWKAPHHRRVATLEALQSLKLTQLIKNGVWYNDRQNRTARPNTCDTAVHRNEGVRFTEDKWHPGSTMRFSTRFIRSRSTIRTVTASAISKASSTNSTTSATSAATQSGSTLFRLIVLRCRLRRTRLLRHRRTLRHQRRPAPTVRPRT